MEHKSLKFWHGELIRIMDWIKFADQKAAFLSVYYSAILGLILTNKNSILQAKHNNVFWLILTIFSLSFITGITFLFKSIYPRLDNQSTNKSCFYYSHVSDSKIVDFLSVMEKLGEEEAKKQIFEQIHANSCIANTKMKNVKMSIKFLLVSILFCLIFIFII